MNTLRDPQIKQSQGPKMPTKKRHPKGCTCKACKGK